MKGEFTMSQPQQSIQLKRQVTLKTLVNDHFRQHAHQEMANELKLLDAQMQQLETQYQHSLNQLEQLAAKGQNVQTHLSQLNDEAQQKRNQLAQLKMQVSTQLANIDKIPDNEYIVTGVLENFVEIKPGDKIYEKLVNAEIIIENSVVKEIRG